jgi:cysteine desulfurase
MVMKQFSCFRKIVSGCEHSSILNAGDIRIPIHPTGELDFTFLESQLKSAISTTLVSVMMANHETGVILDPDNRLADLKKKYSFVLHVDAVQAYGKMPISLSTQDHIDFLTVSAHKVHGLKGVGALYVNGRNSPIAPIFVGGSQERGMRPGTPNMLGIVHFGLVAQELSRWIDNPIVKSLRDTFEESVADIAMVNGKDAPRIGTVSNITLKDTNFTTIDELQLFLEGLSNKGLCVSGTSACSTGFGEPSRTLLSMYGTEHYNLFNSIRIGFPSRIGILSHYSDQRPDGLVERAVDLLKQQLNEGVANGEEQNS